VRKGNNMKQASTINIYIIVLFSLLQISGISYAHEQPITDNIFPASTNIANDEAKLLNNAETSLNLFKEWGNLVTDRTQLPNNKTVNSQQNENSLANEIATNDSFTEELFTIDKVKNLQQQIDLRFQTGLYSLKNNYVLSSHYPTLISNQFLVPNLAQNDLYQFGRFRTETGYSDTNNTNEQSFKAFLHSAYSLINRGRFDLSVTASIESIDSMPSIMNLERQAQTPSFIGNNEQSTSATVGVIGSFDLSDRWSLIGAVTSSHLTSDNSNTLTLDESTQKMALIGTTYSF